MLSSLEALNAAGASSGRSAAFQPKVKPRARKGANASAPAEKIAPVTPEPVRHAPRPVSSPPSLEVPTATRSAIPKPPSIPAVEAVPSAPPGRRLGKEPVQFSSTPPVSNVGSRPSSSQAPREPAEGPPSSSKEKRRIHSSAPRKRKSLETVEDVDPTKMSLKSMIKFLEAKERKKHREDSAAKKLEQATTPSPPPIRSEEVRERFVPLAPQVEIVNGNVVINQDSLQVDAGVINRDDMSSYRRIEESHSKLNYHSYVVVPKGKWNKEETEMFYKALKQFGTDFEVIQKLFPSKSRRQIKAKYKKEEKENPSRMTDTILNPNTDMAQYEELVERLKAAAAQKSQAEDEYDFTWNLNSSGTQDNEAEASQEQTQAQTDELNNEADARDAEEQETEMDVENEAPKRESSSFVDEAPSLFAFQSFRY